MSGFGNDPMAMFRQVAMGGSPYQQQHQWFDPSMLTQQAQQWGMGMPQQGQAQQPQQWFNPAMFMPQQQGAGPDMMQGQQQSPGLGYNFQQLMQQAMNWPGAQQGQQAIAPMLQQPSPLIPQPQAPTVNPMAFQPMQPQMPQAAPQQMAPQQQAAPQPEAPSQDAINAAIAAAQEQARRELADRVSYLGGGSEGGGESG